MSSRISLLRRLSVGVVDQLLDMPMLAGYLDAGLTAFDLSCDAIGQID